MPKYWMPPVYNVEGRNQQWLNNIVGMHDVWCGCNKPFVHLFHTLITKNGFNQLTPTEIQEIKQCLGPTSDKGTSTEEKDTEKDGPEGDLTFGDLEKLFEEDGEFPDDDDR